ncbi:MAG: hypothetical protein U1E27_04200 [Kiritimatiellia bacterium]|nr:hypothetical protein [Kiritimatiellia bacterium]
MKWKLKHVVAFCVMGIMLGLLRYLYDRGFEAARFQSPDGEYYLVARQMLHNPFEIAMPGDGGWRPYYFSLHRASDGKFIARNKPNLKKLGLIKEGVHIRWWEDCVVVPGDGIDILRYDGKPFGD